MSNPSVPLLNLLILQHKMDNLHRFLSRSVNHSSSSNNNSNAQEQQQIVVSSEISSAIRDIISNGAALLSSCQGTLNNPPMDLKVIKSNPEEEEEEEEEEEGMNIVELDAMELLAEHAHFCDICGKGFKRDANLRMHMRAHGNQYKTPEALVKPKNDNNNTTTNNKAPTTRFSCPFSGCNRNKAHKKFRTLKSATCVKNHFKRSHCPKMFSCHKCNKKSFSVVADLKSHLKNCGECRWQCCCGTSFSRKDKLFGHMALFEGHMPSMPSSVTCVTTIPSSSSSKQQQQQQQQQDHQQQQDFDDDDDDDDDASGLGFFEHDFVQGDCFDSITNEDDLFDPGFSFPAFDPPSFLPSFYEQRD